MVLCKRSFLLMLGLLAAAPLAVADAGIPSLVVQASPGAGEQRSFDGVVEAVRQTVVAAQVAGAVVEIAVRPGQAVKAGQLLVRLDSRAAQQGASAALAQSQAVRAALALAQSDLARQRQLRAQGFISSAALDRAEAEFKSTEAQSRAQIAQSEAAATTTGLHNLHAPYDGVVAEVPVMPGEMALPGRALVQLYDPTHLRVSASLPQAVAASQAGLTPAAVRIELDSRPVTPSAVQLLPLADAATQTAVLRADLPKGIVAQPGQFARVWLNLPAGSAGVSTPAPARLRIPLSAVLRRAELDAVYVIAESGRPLLRQLRLGAVEGGSVEVLAGLRAGERIATAPNQVAVPK